MHKDGMNKTSYINMQLVDEEIILLYKEGS